jgi:DNA-binding GntR family transcriptional regulator
MTLAADPTPLARRSLHAALTERVAELIVVGDLPPGGKVPERALCERFGVSRTPMREALKVLAAEGLVTLAPNRGAWVTAVTVAELEEVFPVMGALEALSGELACARITDAEIVQVAELHEQMLGHYRDRALPAYFRVNQAIHGAILDAARNATLTAQHRGLAARVRRARHLANMTDARWRQATEEHEAILAALRGRDGPALAAVLKTHLANKFDSVRDWLAREASRKAAE